jgi:hypothetical protein
MAEISTSRSRRSDVAFSENNSFIHTTTSDAQFRAWAQAIHDRLAAVGLNQTADTGQINLVTVVAPAINTDAGYEIWNFTDTEQGTDPIFFKVTYGKAAQTQRGRVTFQVGTGSNGTGTLTNPGTARIQAPAIDSNGNGYIGACFRDGALSLMIVADPTTAAQANFIFFAIERLRNADATLIAGAFALIYTPGGGNDVRMSGAWQANNHAFMTGGGQPLSGKVTFGRLIPGINVISCAPLRCVLMARSGVVSAGDSGDVTIAGAAKTYKRPVGNHVVVPSTAGTGSTDANNLLMPAS